MKKIEPWLTVENEELITAPARLTISRQTVRLPDGRLIDDYYQIKLQEYVVVFAQLQDQRVLVERQYKHGVSGITLTLPSGLIEGSETPLSAAQRELLEETGYVSLCWYALGSFVPHGNYGCGRAHLFMAKEVRQIALPASGDLEETEVLLMSPDEVTAAVLNGQVEVLSSVTATLLALTPVFNSNHHG